MILINDLNQELNQKFPKSLSLFSPWEKLHFHVIKYIMHNQISYIMLNHHNAQLFEKNCGRLMISSFLIDKSATNVKNSKNSGW